MRVILMEILSLHISSHMKPVVLSACLECSGGYEAQSVGCVDLVISKQLSAQASCFISRIRNFLRGQPETLSPLLVGRSYTVVLV